jgi:hypothetical protein
MVVLGVVTFSCHRGTPVYRRVVGDVLLCVARRRIGEVLLCVAFAAGLGTVQGVRGGGGSNFSSTLCPPCGK